MDLKEFYKLLLLILNELNTGQEEILDLKIDYTNNIMYIKTNRNIFKLTKE